MQGLPRNQNVSRETSRVNGKTEGKFHEDIMKKRREGSGENDMQGLPRDQNVSRETSRVNGKSSWKFHEDIMKKGREGSSENNREGLLRDQNVSRETLKGMERQGDSHGGWIWKKEG